MIGFMPTEGVGAIGSLEVSSEERKRLARRSVDWTCAVCGVCNRDALTLSVEGESHDKAMAEAADIVTQMAFKVSLIYLIWHFIFSRKSLKNKL